MMESTTHKNWRAAEEEAVSQRKAESSKENWSNEKLGNGNVRRLSDGAAAPLGRTRSFKTKQLVRSQAIRESQSPPRVPSPRPLGKAENKQAVKKKSLSVDSDDRNLLEDYTDVCVDRKPIILKKSDTPNTIENQASFNLKSKCDNNLGAISKNDDKFNNSGDICDSKTSEPTVPTTKMLNSGINKANVDNVFNETGNNNDSCDVSNLDSTKSIINSCGVVSTNITVGCSTPSHYAMHKYNNLSLIKQSSLDKCDYKSEVKESKNSDLKKQNSINSSQGTNRTNTKVDFQQVEIQVTSGDCDTSFPTNLHDNQTVIYQLKGNTLCDCMSLDEEEEKEKNVEEGSGRGRRATCPSKQDSGICCWEQCYCCTDLSPDSNASLDADDDLLRSRKYKHTSEHDVHHQSIDSCKCQDKWSHRKSGSTLTVQRATSGGNPRLLRKQSSGGSVDSGQHSIASPFLSRDNSTELMINNFESLDLNKFVKETLNKSYKDRITLLKIEHELISLVKDPTRYEHKFSQSSSYGRLLIHRCAELFGLKHGVDTTKQYVYVTKPPTGGPSCKIPIICPFQQWCTENFLTSPTTFCLDQSLPAKSILKRDAHSLDDEGVTLQTSRPSLRSKSFEQREEEYTKARQRIFNSNVQEEHWDWEERKEIDPDVEHCKPKLQLPESERVSRATRLTKVHSLEGEERVGVVRGVVSRAHSFGGYGDRQESCVSATSTPSTRKLSQKGELASNSWRLSPGNSSGYRTLSARSDSITPSPTPISDSIPSGVLWAITDMSSVPIGAVIIHPQSGQPLTNSDGSLYHYDPAHPPNVNLLSTNQVSTDGIRILTNPERRRSRLEKQRAMLSPGIDLLNEKNKTNENISPLTSKEIKTDSQVPDDTVKENKDVDIINKNDSTPCPCYCQECQAVNENNLNDDVVTSNTNTASDVQSEIQFPNIDQSVQDAQPEPITEAIPQDAGPPLRECDTNIPGEPPTHVHESMRNAETTKILEQVVAAEYYMPSENYIYGSGYENVPEITVDPNLLDHAIQLENATEIETCNLLINKAVKEEYCEENTSREVIMERREDGYDEIILNTFQSVQPQQYYDAGVHPVVPYGDTMPYEEHTSEIQPFPGCCGPVAPMIVRGPLPLSLSPYVSATNPPPPPHSHMYQGGWAWPTMLYATQPAISHPSVDIPKVPTHGFIAQPGNGNVQANSNVPPTYFQHGQTPSTVMIAPSAPQSCFPYAQQSGFIPLPQQPIYHTYPLYQYQIPGRSSVPRQDRCPTPGFQPFDTPNASFPNTIQPMRPQDDTHKNCHNIKSPRNVLSREPSHSGSSRTTPLINNNQQNIPINNNVVENFPNLEQNIVHMGQYVSQEINEGAQANRYMQEEQATVIHSNKIKTNHLDNSVQILSNEIKIHTNSDQNARHDEISTVDALQKKMDSNQKILQAKSFDSFSANKITDKAIDRRKSFRNSSSLNILCRQDSFDQGNNYKDKTNVPIIETSVALDNQFVKHNTKYNKSPESQTYDNHCVQTYDNHCVQTYDNHCVQTEVIENYPIQYSPAKVHDTSNIQDITQENISTKTNKNILDITKIKAVLDEVQRAEISKLNIRDNNIRSYLNFPKSRHNNFYKQRDESKDTKKYYNRDHVTQNASQVSTSSWVYRGSDHSQYNKNSTVINSAPYNAHIHNKPNGEKYHTYHQNSTNKHYNKDYAKKENKEQCAAPNNNVTNNQQVIVKPLPSTTSTNNAFNKSSHRASRTPPVVNNYNQNSGNLPMNVEHNNIMRSQVIQTLGGVSLLQTPPQSLFIRQIPGWLRRPPSHSIFGSPPPIAPHIRAPRPTRTFTHNVSYRQR